MKKMYFKSALALGVIALAGSNAMAEGSWSNINSQLKNPAFIPGWSGMLTAANEGVGEAWDAPFEVYQVVNNAPAGQYTLTANAFYRYGSNDYAVANMSNGANHYAYLFLGDSKEAVEGLFDAKQEGCPNSTAEASAAFANGEYLNTVTFNHEGGDLRLGIALTEYRQDQWCCFDNFKLTGPNGIINLVNGDFTEGLDNSHNEEIWDMLNVQASAKTPDINKEGGANGCFRKTNASPYNFGQLVTLEKGKYRFGVQSFFRYGNGNQSGWYIKLKGFERVEGESAYDVHVAGAEDASLFPLLYVAKAAEKPLDASEVAACEFYKETPVKCIFDEDLTTYPDNEPETEAVAEGEHGYADSGYEHEAAALFVANPELYRNYVEFELEETTSVWVGLKKDSNAPTHYWHPFRDFTLEKYVGEAGVNNVVVADENAPVEYFNLQGVRVANPENGLFIVKQGNKVSKQVIR